MYQEEEVTVFGEMTTAVIEYYAPFRPGRYQGAPEDCFESQPEEIDFYLIDPDLDRALMNDGAEYSRIRGMLIRCVTRGDGE